LHRSLKQRLEVIGICCAVIVIAMIFSMINNAIPTIKVDLSASMTQVVWVMNIFGIVGCSTLVTFGRLADIFGRKKLFLFGQTCQIISLVGSGLSHSIHWIIFFQIFSGMGNGILLTVSQAMLTENFGEENRNKALGLWSSMIGLSLAIGPVLSGFLITHFGWRWIFFAPLPVVAVGMVLVFFFARESRNTLDTPKLDLLGMGLLIVTISAFTLGIIEGHHFSTLTTTFIFIISGVALLLLLLVERKAKEPIIREDLFTNRRFVLASLCSCSFIFIIWASFFILPLFYQHIVGYSALQTGLILMCITIPLASLSAPVAKLYQHMPVKVILSIGFMFILVATMCELFFNAHTPWWFFCVSSAFIGIAFAMILGPATTAAVSTLTKERAGIATGTFMTIQEVGGNLGLAITTAVVDDHLHFSDGFHHGMWVLVIVSALGLLSALLIKSGRLEQQP
jgi:EmrB/QacA subfamily drug resistance transporter